MNPNMPYLWLVSLEPQAAWRAFAAHHYLPHLPGPNRATYVLSCRCLCPSDTAPAGCACFTLPPVSSAPRNLVFGPLFKPSFTTRRTAAKLVQACITTLSRMVILPSFRQRNLAADFLKAAAATFTTPILEAHSIIARSLPFFAKAGLTVLKPPLGVYTRQARAGLAQYGIPPGHATAYPSLKRRLLALDPPTASA